MPPPASHARTRCWLLFDEQLTPGPARDLSDSRGTGNTAADLPEHLVADRSTLRRILYTALENVVRFGSRVTGYRRNPDSSVTVHLAGRRSAEADVLVGADGINSAVRVQRLPCHTAVDLGARHTPDPRCEAAATARTSAARILQAQRGSRPRGGRGWPVWRGDFVVDSFG